MRRQEARAAGELAGAALGGTGSFIRDVHAAIAARPFRAVGPLGTPARAIHDRLSQAAYRSVSTAIGAVPRAGAAALARSIPAGGPPLASSLRGSLALGALNGAVGDALARQESALELPMSLRRRGRDVELDPSGLGDAFPDATGALAVFVHGLCETDEAWHLRPFAGGDRLPPSYGARLRDELGWTPLYLRYNSGLRISENGRRFADLLDRVVEAWPVDVAEIALVGHSMGGLVARSACHYGAATDARWTRAVRHVFCLGSPHLGAPLEKAANVAGYALARLPETRPLARIVNGRSVGIKDLRFGACVEEDWCDCDPDEFLQDRCREVPFLEGASYYFVAATVAPDPDGVVGSLVGDLLVRPSSASGRGRRRRIAFELGHHVGGANHFQLLNHPAVYDQIRGWMDGRT